MNRDFIKYIAILAMTFDHIAIALLYDIIAGKKIVPEPIASIKQVYYLMTCVGSMTAPVMIYFIIEGCYKTRSRLKYLIRLLITAIISEIPFRLAFKSLGSTGNMIWTLALCLIVVWTYIKYKNIIVNLIVISIAFLINTQTDWKNIAIPFTVLMMFAFDENGNADKKKLVLIFIICTLYYLINHRLFFSIGLIIGFILLLFYNGRKSQRFTQFNKVFFYVYYPLHLMILYLLK